VLDIREQFPLLPSDTKQIAIDSGIKHPAIRGADQVMSTDFLVDCKDVNRPDFYRQFIASEK